MSSPKKLIVSSKAPPAEPILSTATETDNNSQHQGTKRKQSLQDLENAVILQRLKAKKSKTLLHPAKSFDTDFWVNAARHCEDKKEEARLQIEFLLAKYLEERRGTEDQFFKTVEAREMLIKSKTLGEDVKIRDKMRNRLTIGTDVAKAGRRVFI